MRLMALLGRPRGRRIETLRTGAFRNLATSSKVNPFKNDHVNNPRLERQPRLPVWSPRWRFVCTACHLARRHSVAVAFVRSHRVTWSVMSSSTATAAALGTAIPEWAEIALVVRPEHAARYECYRDHVEYGKDHHDEGEACIRHLYCSCTGTGKSKPAMSRSPRLR